MENLKKRGRPFKDGALDETRNKILISARPEFVEKGFAATSISHIAKKAQVNQSLIYHYFKSKEDLWNKVKEQILCDYGRFQDFPADNETTLREFLTFIVTQRAEFYEHHPDVSRMMLWQRLENKGLEGGTQAVPAQWRAPLKRLVEQGKIRSHLEVEYIIELITNAVTGLYLSPFTPFFQDPLKRKYYLEMVIDCLEKGLQSKG